MKKYIEKNREQLIEDISELIQIPSVKGAAVKGAPFGEAIGQAMEHTLRLAESFGLVTVTYYGYASEIRAGNTQGESPEKIIGILCHIDVVPAGEGWNTDPFHAEIIEGNLYGRGVIDDKGPIVSCLYAMKYLMEENLIPVGTEVRLILGTDEESTWEDMPYYLEHASRLPDRTIVPDANFPLIFCEKGLLNFDLTYHTQSKDETAALRIISLEGGNARNIVPAKAVCKLVMQKDEELCKRIVAQVEQCPQAAITAERRESDIILEIIATGKSVHCMTPEKGLNAISLMMEILFNLENTSHRDFIESYNKHIGMSYNGEQMDMVFSDEASGPLTFNVGKIMFQDNQIQLDTDIRYPASTPPEDVINAFELFASNAGFWYTQTQHMQPVCQDKGSSFVRLLMDAYRDVTGDHESVPIAIGGTTYAKAMPNAVAFGPLFPWEEELAHEPNEFLALSSLEKMTEVYAAALIKLLNEPC